jgi:hypothetical protein
VEASSSSAMDVGAVTEAIHAVTHQRDSPFCFAITSRPLDDQYDNPWEIEDEYDEGWQDPPEWEEEPDPGWADPPWEERARFIENFEEHLHVPIPESDDDLAEEPDCEEVTGIVRADVPA